MQAFASAVASGSLPQLRDLRLYENQIGDGGMQAFASAVASGSLPSLKTLLIGNNKFTDAAKEHMKATCQARGIEAKRDFFSVL